jgi:putative ABC transport system permease protein
MVWQDEVRRRVAALPGVEAVSWATKLPIGGRSSLGTLSPVGVAPGAGAAANGSLNRVSPDYFRSMGIAVRQGRDFTEGDRAGAPGVAIVNEVLARALFGTTDVIGRRFYSGQGQYRREFEVVGLAGESRLTTPGQPPEQALYVPLAQMYNPQAHLHVRALPGMESTVVSAVRSAIRETSTSIPIPDPRPLVDALDLYLLPQRLAALVAATMGVFGLLLAGVGIYGVAAFAASRRGREVAIRMALGATDRDVTRLLVRGGARAPLVGLVIGLAIGAALSMGAATVIPGVRVADPAALGLVAAVITLLSAIALAMPVRGMLRSAPMRRLREE